VERDLIPAGHLLRGPRAAVPAPCQARGRLWRKPDDRSTGVPNDLVFRCTLSWFWTPSSVEIPAWMFHRAACGEARCSSSGARTSRPTQVARGQPCSKRPRRVICPPSACYSTLGLRSEVGHHHHVAGPYLLCFARESVWREDHRKDRTGFQVNRVAMLALRNKPSVDFCGYWQR
jgi:hypothetical protein